MPPQHSQESPDALSESKSDGFKIERSLQFTIVISKVATFVNGGFLRHPTSTSMGAGGVE